MLAIYCRTSKESADSTIEQQEQRGVNFAIRNHLEFRVYRDEGKSGFRVDDETNPFSHRPAFTNLINDIKSGEISKVWVLEHSRLSRNQYASAFIFNVLEKHSVTLYENDRELSLKDPQYQFMRQILDAVSQYERNLIVNRTTRGLHNAIDSGRRAHSRFYGYRRIGRDDTGHTEWEPVESELEKIRLAYGTILEGGTLRNVIRNLYSSGTGDAKESLKLSTKWNRILSHFEYTGYCLNMEGLEVLHSYQRFELDNLQALIEPKFRVKSVPYPVELIGVDDWVVCAERLHLNRVARKEALDKSSRRAHKDLCTGLIRCGCCEGRYYSYLTKYRDKLYPYYKHISSLSNRECCQKPKTLAVSKIDDIYKIFYFYFYLVFDDTKRLIEESIREIKNQQIEIRERMGALERQLIQSKNQIRKFTTALDDTDDMKVVRVLAGRISNAEERTSKDTELLSSLKVELEKCNDRYSGTELQNTYYSVKERIVIFFERMNVEQQRSELLRVVRKSTVFGNCLVIEAGMKLFIFDISPRKTHRFDQDSYDKLMRDEVYLDNFLNLNTVQKFEALQYGDRFLTDWCLDERLGGESMRTIIGDYLKKLGVTADLERVDHVISFLDIQRFMAFMMVRTASVT